MIRWTRSARIVPAKYMEAIHWAKEIAEFISKKHGVQTTVYWIVSVNMEQSAGSPITRFGDLGEIRLINFSRSRNYLQRLSQAPDLMVPGSVFDTVMRSI